ncbi:ChaN family lipoprotein [Marinobacterium sp. D7]|uniref:ChaN family lipoprotein n=1 Tax=Marinobacterium ramblicola TaxID=2849041 RepID=UPI001C2DE209|nr:ChaN family lipoprotein [Marinobacterium ramblicola]MBV1786713.1 ChaN family lipoprotein [Marinobacterium ramblicola]
MLLRVLAGLLLLISISVQAVVPSPNPLVGKLWSPVQQRYVAWPEFYRDWLPTGGWLLLGEQHDNPDHHKQQSRLIQALGERGQLGAVALEMATPAQQAALDRALHDPDARTPDRLAWSEGWPWTLYQAPLQAAFRWSSRVLGADLSRPEVRALYTANAAVAELEPAHADFMLDLLYESHCRQLPREQLQPMRRIQLARDQQIASVLRANARPDRTGVLLTGSIHARADLGVPRWLGSLPRRTVLMVAVTDDTDPAAYLPESFGDLGSADLLLFTPQVDAPDYCADLQLKSN